jgi:hypothetical protein
MKYLVLTALCASFSAIAQSPLQFNLATSGPAFHDADVGAMTLADVDNDGDLDAFISGKGGPVQSILYLNDGNGGFSQSSSNFTHLYGGSVVFFDADGDGDVDLFESGSTSGGIKTAELYVNNGNGGFSLFTGTSFPGLWGGTSEAADFDSDGDLDLIYTGVTSNSESFVYLFQNTSVSGSLSFSSPFVLCDSLELPRALVLDYEQDGDIDLLVSGKRANGVCVTKVVKNQGLSGFPTFEPTSLPGACNGRLSLGDVDLDGDLDLLLNGDSNPAGSQISGVYENQGSGSYVSSSTYSLIGSGAGFAAWQDLDLDGDLDAVVAGFGTPGVFAYVYQNQGVQGYILSDTLEGAYFSSVAMGDLDGDFRPDIILAGTSFGVPMRATRTYWNATSIPFSIKESVLSGHLRIYPNPAQENVNVSWDFTPTSEAEVQVMDLLGRLIHEERISPGPTIRLDISSLSPGTYLLRLNDAGRLSQGILVVD